MKTSALISIFICVVAFVCYALDPVTVATIFGAVITGLTTTAQAATVVGKLSGDAVAIKIHNHFRYVNFVREADYIHDGEEYEIPAMTILKGQEGCAGGFDDGWWNAGGVSGAVRYSMQDPNGLKYCMDVLYANNQGYAVDFGAFVGYYDGWAVAVGSDLCNLNIQNVFNDWTAYSYFSSQPMGARYAFGGNTWTSYGKAGNTGYSTTGNSDAKISWMVDMDANSVSTLTVEVGPYNWWLKTDSYFEDVVGFPLNEPNGAIKLPSADLLNAALAAMLIVYVIAVCVSCHYALKRRQSLKHKYSKCAETDSEVEEIMVQK